MGGSSSDDDEDEEDPMAKTTTRKPAADFTFDDFRKLSEKPEIAE